MELGRQVLVRSEIWGDGAEGLQARPPDPAEATLEGNFTDGPSRLDRRRSGLHDTGRKSLRLRLRGRPVGPVLGRWVEVATPPDATSTIRWCRNLRCSGGLQAGKCRAKAHLYAARQDTIHHREAKTEG